MLRKPSPRFANPTTLASIGTRRITQMNDISILLMNFLERRKAEIQLVRITLPRTTVHKPRICFVIIADLPRARVNKLR